MTDRHDQNTEDEYPRTVDFEPEPELFDVNEVAAEIWAATHPKA
jgi:hypothetical protein